MASSAIAAFPYMPSCATMTASSKCVHPSATRSHPYARGPSESGRFQKAPSSGRSWAWPVQGPFQQSTIAAVKPLTLQRRHAPENSQCNRTMSSSTRSSRSGVTVHRTNPRPAVRWKGTRKFLLHEKRYTLATDRLDRGSFLDSTIYPTTD